MTRIRLLFPSTLFTLGSVISVIPGPAQAGTATSTISVSATVITQCIIVTVPLAFGNYASTTVSNSVSNITVTCTLSVPYNVGLGVGGGTGATVAARKMTNGTTTLNYSMFSDPGMTTQWGPTIGTNTVAGIGSGLAQILPIYGQVPSGQTVATGLYTDVVTATLNF